MTTKNLDEFIIGVTSEFICEYVILAPCWSPQSIGIHNMNLLAKGSCEVWDCSVNGVKFTYIVSGVGACNCADIVMVLGETRCKYALFIGSAGALQKEIDIGDMAMPKDIICGEGASRYLQENMSCDCFGKSFSSDINLYGRLYRVLNDCADKYGVNCYEGKGISVESIYSQYRHLDEFDRLGCSFVDMESSAFLAAINNSGIVGAVVFCISDNVKKGEPLYLVSKEQTEYRKRIRRKIMPDIIWAFLEGGSEHEYNRI